jgi:hypothetical protein
MGNIENSISLLGISLYLFSSTLQLVLTSFLMFLLFFLISLLGGLFLHLTGSCGSQKRAVWCLGYTAFTCHIDAISMPISPVRMIYMFQRHTAI